MPAPRKRSKQLAKSEGGEEMEGPRVPGVEPWRVPCDISKVTIPSADFKTLPADLPMRMVVERICGVFSIREVTNHEVHGLLGHAIGLDFYTKGHGSGTYVEIVTNRDPNAISIEVNGEEVFAWVEDGRDMPLKFDAVLEEERRVGGEFVDQVDLQPGDYVGEDNEVIRADDEALTFDDDDEELFPDDDEELDNDDFLE